MLSFIIILRLIKSASQERALGDRLLEIVLRLHFKVSFSARPICANPFLGPQMDRLKKGHRFEYIIAQPQYHMVRFFRILIEGCTSFLSLWRIYR